MANIIFEFKKMNFQRYTEGLKSWIHSVIPDKKQIGSRDMQNGIRVLYEPKSQR